ncbi:MAG: hypothetical protein AB1586_30735 [Pseudomonadota bacterium]|jgi:uncharacterized membrane protein
MDDVTLARALHVLAVVHWIGGLAFVTLVVLPLARSRRSAEDALALFGAVERRFAAQVRISVVLVGVTGFWMVDRLALWDRFLDRSFWWMWSMVGLWLFFMLMLFVIEPLLHRRFQGGVRGDGRAAVRSMLYLHAVLLGLAAITVFGAVAGAHGLSFI